jgi:hypothetical protein
VNNPADYFVTGYITGHDIPYTDRSAINADAFLVSEFNIAVLAFIWFSTHWSLLLSGRDAASNQAAPFHVLLLMFPEIANPSQTVTMLRAAIVWA